MGRGRATKVARQLKYLSASDIGTTGPDIDGMTRIPSVQGWTLDETRQVLPQLLVIVAGEPATDGLIIAQRPEAGVQVAPGAELTVWLSTDGPGNAGVREPRRPYPTPSEARKTLDPSHD